MSAPRNNILSSVDWITVLIYLALVIFGFMNIYSAALVDDNPKFYDFSQEYGKQFWFMIASFFFGLMILYLEADIFSRLSLILYIVFVFLLLLVLVIGESRGGNQAWINLGVFKLQPAEFAKIGVALLLAKYISSTKAKFNDWKTRLTAAAIIGVPAILILLQPDVGSLLTFVAFTFVLYREGLSGNVLFIGLGAIVIGVISVIAGHATFDYPFIEEKKPMSAIWFAIFIAFILGLLLIAAVRNFVVPRNRNRLYLIIGLSTVLSCGFMGSVQYIIEDVFKPHQRSRIYVTFGLEEKKNDEIDQETGELIVLAPEDKAKADDPGYNARMAKLAVANGGLIGQGYMQGPMTQNKFVPERWTDFIYSVISEEWGFLGSIIVIILFAVLIIRLIFLAERQRSQFSRIYGYGVASVFMIHFIINIGMVIGLAPIIGIPLPFMSYGGSSLLGFTMMLFIMLRLDSERLSIFK